MRSGLANPPNGTVGVECGTKGAVDVDGTVGGGAVGAVGEGAAGTHVLFKFNAMKPGAHSAIHSS